MVTQNTYLSVLQVLGTEGEVGERAFELQRAVYPHDSEDSEPTWTLQLNPQRLNVYVGRISRAHLLDLMRQIGSALEVEPFAVERRLTPRG